MLDLSKFKLTFDDEFNTLSLGGSGTATWQPAYSWAPNGVSDPSMSSWLVNPTWRGTAAADANVYSNSNGITSIAFKPTPADVALSDVGGKSFLSGQITTKQSFAQAYGYFEASVKMPAGAGLNSAFWLLPADGSWPPELDVAEVLGNDPATLVMTAHDNVGGQDKANPSWATIPDASQAFHRYGVDWEPDKITWYFDGVQVAQQATPASMNKPMYMLVDTLAGVAGSWMGGPVPGETAQMQVDYVRAYSSNPNAVAVTPQGGYVAYNGAPGVAPVPVATPVGSLPLVGSLPPVDVAPTSAIVPATHSLTVRVSEDAWQGNAQYTIAVDGATIGGVRTATAAHALGESETVSLSGTWSPGSHGIGISFLNDAYGGSPQTDRNLFVDAVLYDGNAIGGQVNLYSAGTATFVTPVATALRVGLSEDTWNGDAQYAISIDGLAAGTTGSVTALHAAGQVQFVAMQASLVPGAHDIGVTFLNDAYGGSVATDRNLYVDNVEVAGHPVAGAAAGLFSAGTTHFAVMVPTA